MRSNSIHLIFAALLCSQYQEDVFGFTAPIKSNSFTAPNAINSDHKTSLSLSESANELFVANGDTTATIEEPKLSNKKLRNRTYWQNFRSNLRRKNNQKSKEQQANGKTEKKAPTKIEEIQDPKAVVIKENNKINGKEERKSKAGKGSSKNSKKRLLPLDQLKVGAKISGKVVGTSSFGVFVQTKYFTKTSNKGCALLHKRYLPTKDGKMDANITDSYKIGQTIKNATVVDIDFENPSIFLSLLPEGVSNKKGKNAKNKKNQKNSRSNNKRLSLKDVKVGQEFTNGIVKSVEPYGAFVDIGVTKVNALLHISRMTQNKIVNIHNHIKVGQRGLKVRIIDVDTKKKTMACSMLSQQADEYLDKRRVIKEKTKDLIDKVSKGDVVSEEEDPEVLAIRQQLDIFDATIRDLETAVIDDPSNNGIKV